MVNFLLRKIFRGNLSYAISLSKIGVTLKVTSISLFDILKLFINHNKAGISEGSFFLGSQIDSPPFLYDEELI